ncbi:MAG: hypothetical protein OEZ34_07345 [Spirochaetia bacterium]|nr:hypothetical protein [Spirochaetia bacterium]
MNLQRWLLVYFLVLSCLIELSCNKDDNTLPPVIAVDANISSLSSGASFNCFNCHSETTELGNKIEWAKAGWDESVHANGYRAAIYGYNPTTLWTIIGYEWEGSDAFYSNGGGCQVCHTKEGFRKKIAGTYGNYNPLSVGYVAYRSAITTDVIQYPSNLTCFACHSPHEKGNFELLVADGSDVTTETGALYMKSQGSICASCHQVRLSGSASANESILAQVQGNGVSNRTGPHHGPQADMLLGKGGAEYTGKSYGNSSHTANDAANCISCHKVDDFDESKRLSLSPAVGGHSFTTVGIVHGTPKAIDIGCKTTGCHPTGVSAKTISADDGYLLKGDAYFDKSSYYSQLNTTLVKLADPSANCTGLLQTAYNAITGGNIQWKKYPDGITVNKRCIVSSFTKIPANPTATENSNETRFAKAYWNFLFALEDKSFGVHNLRYASQLLYDSCDDLNSLTASGVNCGARP